MGLRDFFSNIINKIRGREVKMLPVPKLVQENTNYEPKIEKNAYVEAYTKSINSENNDLKINEDGTKIKFCDPKTNKVIEIQKILKIKENYEFSEKQIDLYKAFYSYGNKENRDIKKVYFALPAGKGLLDLYKGSSKKASLKKKLKTMFSLNIIESKKSFLGIIIEDEFYKDYSLVKSSKLEEYVVELEKKRQMIKMNKQKSKEQVIKTIGKKDKLQMTRNLNKNTQDSVKKTTIRKNNMQTEEIIGKAKKTKDVIKTLNKVRILNEQN